MDVTIGVINVFIWLGKLFLMIGYYSLKFIIWILNKLRMTVVAIWLIGFFMIAEANVEICQTIRQSEVLSWSYLILGIVILIVSVFWLLGDIIRLFVPYFSFLDVPDYFSSKKRKILVLANETEWFGGLTSKKKIQRRYKALKNCFLYSNDISEQEKLLQIEKEYKSIIANIG